MFVSFCLGSFSPGLPEGRSRLSNLARSSSIYECVRKPDLRHHAGRRPEGGRLADCRLPLTPSPRHTSRFVSPSRLPTMPHLSVFPFPCLIFPSSLFHIVSSFRYLCPLVSSFRCFCSTLSHQSVVSVPGRRDGHLPTMTSPCWSRESNEPEGVALRWPLRLGINVTRRGETA